MLSRPKLLLVSTCLLALFALNGCGSSTPRTSNPPTPPASALITFAANSTSITAGEFVTLTWDVKNAASITIAPSLNEADDGTLLPMSGTRTLVLQTTTVYTLTATGSGGVITTKQLTVAVQNAFPTVKLETDPTIIVAGASSALRWSTTSTTDLTINNGIGKVAPGVGSVNVSPAATTTYTATATGPAGAATASATVTVAASLDLVVILSASKVAIASGEKTMLTWTSQNATTVTISPSVGAVNTSGTLEVAPTVTTTYVATATSAAGATTTASVTVTVLGAAAGLQNIKHIVFFIQENRSFDNYFGLLGAYRKSKGLTDDVDGLDLTLQLKTHSGKTVTPFHQRTVETDVMTPSWNESHFYLDRKSSGEFKMDNWMMQSTCSILVATDPECTRTMGYYDQRDIPYYYEVATQFATSDRFYSSALSGTIVNRSFLLAATAGGMNNPGDPFPVHAATIFRTLSEAGISWKYYYQDDSVFLGYFSCGGSCDWDKYMGNVFPISNYYETWRVPPQTRTYLRWSLSSMQRSYDWMSIPATTSSSAWPTPQRSSTHFCRAPPGQRQLSF